MSDAAQTVVRFADLPQRKDTRFNLTPEGKGLEGIRDRLDLTGLSKLRFQGRLSPAGARDWVLSATLGATVVQPCGVTLAPVSTRIDETVTRRYAFDLEEGETGSEMEMPEDDELEALPATLDLAEVMEEALALALPLFPRAKGAELANQTSALTAQPKDATPMTDEDTKPFAALKALRDSLNDKDSDAEG